ncbi:MAG: hypothetical protein K6U80_19345 [Firmicutes bacterium]|nr:hypothetical protein [Bacillota bacterium]
METKVIAVTNVKKGANRRVPRITLSGCWLNEIGFVSGKLAVAKYDHGIISLRLEESENYRNLVRGAFKDGSGLFQIYGRTRNQKTISQIQIYGIRLETLGFAIGRFTLVQYEYGFIQIKLIDLDKVIDRKQLKE